MHHSFPINSGLHNINNLHLSFLLMFVNYWWSFKMYGNIRLSNTFPWWNLLEANNNVLALFVIKPIPLQFYCSVYRQVLDKYVIRKVIGNLSILSSIHSYKTMSRSRWDQYIILWWPTVFAKTQLCGSNYKIRPCNQWVESTLKCSPHRLS